MASDMASPNRHRHVFPGNSPAAAAEAPPPLPNNVATPRRGISSDLSLPHDDRRIISPSNADTAPLDLEWMLKIFHLYTSAQSWESPLLMPSPF